MQTIQLLKYTFNKGNLSLSIPTESLPSNWELCLINRHSKELLSCTVTSTEVSRSFGDITEVKLSFSSIPFNIGEMNKEIHDVCIKAPSKNFLRLKMENPPVKKKAAKHSINLYPLDDQNVSLPYITRDNELSILTGSAPQCIENLFTVQPESIVTKKQHFQGNNLLFDVSSLTLKENGYRYLVCEDMLTSEQTVIPHQIEKNGATTTCSADLSDLNVNSTYRLLFITVIGRTYYKQELLIVNQLESIEHKLNETRFVKLSVSNTCALLIQLFQEPGAFAELHEQLHLNDSILLENVYVHDQKLFIQFLDKTIKMDRYNYYLQNENTKEYADINEFIKEEGFGMLSINLAGFLAQKQGWSKWHLVLTSSQEDNLSFTSEEDVPAIHRFSLYPKDELSNQREIGYYSKAKVFFSKNKEIIFIMNQNANYVEAPSFIHTELHDIKDLSYHENTFSFYFLNEWFTNQVDHRFYFEERSTKEKYMIRSAISEDGRISLNVQEFMTKLHDQKSRWDLYAAVYYSNTPLIGQVGLYTERVNPSFKRYFSQANVQPIELGEAVNHYVVSSYLNANNAISAVSRDERFFGNEKYKPKTKLKNLKMKNERMSGHFSIKVPNVEAFTVQSLTIKLRSKVEHQEHSIAYAVESSKHEDGWVNVAFNLNFEDFRLKPFYYEFFVTLKIGNDTVYKRLETGSSKLKKKINNSVISYNYFDNDQHAVIYPYITPSNVLFLAFRQMSADEKKQDRLNELVAYPLYVLLKPILKNKRYWLVYEKNSESAQDNSYYFFKYCYENHYDKNIYYVIKKDSPDYANVKAMSDRVIPFMSIKHLLYMCGAKLLVASETRGHLYTWRHQKGKVKEILNNKPFVFLQHGVTALKLNDSILRKESPGGATMYVTTSDFEKKVIMDGLGYKEQDIMVTGFPRWDHLNDKSHLPESKAIFLMPTWRGWLDEVPEDEFIETPYYKNYMALLNSPELAKMLDEFDLTLNFFIHPKFKEYIHRFTALNERVRIISFGEEPVNELLMRSSLLLTDYSSVAWEFYYLGKPVIFYQFDIHDYERLTGSYIDMNEGLFGDRVFDPDTLISTISHYVHNGFKEKEEYAKQRDDYFAYIDNNNSERIYQELIQNEDELVKRHKKKKKTFKAVLKGKLKSNRFTYATGKRLMRLKKKFT
ncbi:CDP-glycerol glycerophosphotransferase family protein [Shouchella sp. JSM 1781072]|uniref:CDP-glycerol glycerophosphotransferase family protein n=1 Tax=Shouchella sp. JSM 1781072 TaxID=3344581 RepID=UPI0035C0BDD8